MKEFNEDLDLVQGVFSDTGEGEEDFYAYWYSLCYVISFLGQYRNKFLNIKNDEFLLARFLESRGICFSKLDDVNILKFIYVNWLNELSKRGTDEINVGRLSSEELGNFPTSLTGDIALDIVNNCGIGIVGKGIDCILNSTINLGTKFIIEFELSLFDDSGTQPEIDGYLLRSSDDINYIYIQSDNTIVDGVVLFNMIFAYSGIQQTISNIPIKSDSKVKIKIIKINHESYLFIDDVFFIYTKDESSLGDYYFSYLILGYLPFLCNIKAIELGGDLNELNHYLYKCNIGSGTWVPCEKGFDYWAEFKVRSTEVWNNLWSRVKLFNNTGFRGVDGELRRLVSYNRGEFIHELVKDSELGMVIDMSSFLSEEADFVNFNKAFEKGDVKDISKYPLNSSATIRATFDNVSKSIKYTLPSDNVDFFGINSGLSSSPDWRTNSAYKPTGLIPFLPINVSNFRENLDGYECSFYIKSSAYLDIEFGLLPYGTDLQFISNLLVDYASDSPNNNFLSESNFTLCYDRFIHIRAVFSLNKLLTVGNELNINLGNNLYSSDLSDGLKFVVPFLRFRNSGTVETEVFIKEFVFRPLSVNTVKGIIAPKNNMFGILKNESVFLKEEVLSKIEDDLIPSNCTTNIKFLQ